MIRTATSADCHKLAVLHILTWQQAYAGLMPQSFLEGLDLELDNRSKQWTHAISENAVSVLLDYDDDTLIGFAACGKCRDSDAEPTWGELGALYYLESFWGTGRAPILYHEALEHLKENGNSLVTLWVLDGNSRAIAFYQKHGFTFDGREKVEEKADFTIRELRMTKQLLA
jgi:GNAT superfamily N-acetyltransferase